MIIIYLKSKQNTVIYENYIYHVYTTKELSSDPIEAVLDNCVVTIHNSEVINSTIIFDRVIHVNDVPKLYSFKKSIDDLYSRHLTIQKPIPLAKSYYPVPIAHLPSKQIILHRDIFSSFIFFTLFINCLPLVKYIIAGISFLMDEPIGIKQNKLINQYIGHSIISTFKIYENSNYCTLAHLYFHIYIISMVVFTIYNVIMKMVMEIFDIFQGRCYNQLKNRYDKNEFEYDQIIISVLLLTILLLVMYNVMGYYIFFAAMTLVYIAIRVVMKMAVYCFVDFTNYVHRIAILENGSFKIERVTRKDVFMFGMWFAYKTTVKKNIFMMLLKGDNDLLKI